MVQVVVDDVLVSNLLICVDAARILDGIEVSVEVSVETIMVKLVLKL